MEEVNVMGNYNFNAMGQKHPDFSWSSPGGTTNAWKQNNSRFQGAPGFENQPRPQYQPQQPTQFGLEDIMKSFIVNTDEILDAHGEAIKELGTEVAPENESGKELKIENAKKTEKKKGKKGVEKKKEETSRKEESDDVSKHMSALPFPQKLYREKLDKQFERFLDMLRQVNVNLPFTEVLSQMPVYANFLKEILTKKRKMEETSVVKLTEHCKAILQNKLTSREKMKNEIGEIRSAPISLQLADQITIRPEGILEDVLVRVDKFVFPVDFIVVNMEENKEVPVILGRPFLVTGRAILDKYDRKLMLRVGEETVTFEMNVETRVKKEKLVINVEWKVKSSKENAPVIEKDKCGVYPKNAEKKLSAWMCALVRA
ncbi:uncharacterized protein [Nicotiana tomentosiformis]|uniref:uncharacterized protein n=1 Tax=Nicotiana tomentosiformis TaxID=4098 RepID=UPI00388C43D6